MRGDQYAVALALIVNGKVEIGVLGCPNITGGYLPDPGGSGTLAVAVRGEGAWQTEIENSEKDFTPLQVSDVRAPEQARLLRSVESGHTNIGKMDYLARRAGRRSRSGTHGQPGEIHAAGSWKGRLVFKISLLQAAGLQGKDLGPSSRFFDR